MIQQISDSFQCWYCEKNLINNRYVIKNNFAICLNCFDEKYSNHCFKCNEIISIETQGIIFENKSWHNICFNCFICQKSLINNKFAYRKENLYCRSCFINQFSEQCYRCTRSLEPDDKCIEYDKKLYHRSCFVCHACQQTLINIDFRRRDQYFLCLSCHLRLVAIYCIKCQKAITTNGIVYHNHPFHMECFRCTNCNTPLENQRYIEYNNNAYCSFCLFILMKPAV